MYSFIKKVISAVTAWGSDEPVINVENEEQKIIDSIKCLNIDSEEISEITSQKQLLCGQSDTVEIEVETFGCIHKSGQVTKLCDEYGLIDNLIYFEPNQVSKGLRLKLGDEVLYSAYKLKENETYRVFQIYARKNDCWDDEVNSNKLQTGSAGRVEEINALTRFITGRVTERKGREFYIESADVWCHLDKISATYIPIEGDWVELEALVSINVESADLAGDILEIKSVKPLLSKVGVGRVTFWCELKEEGAIENLIYFTRIACEHGYIPALGDEVFYDAVESDQDSYRWRAVKVEFNVSKQENSMSGSQSTDSLSKEGSGPFSDKNDIKITPAVCAIEIELNQKKTVIFEVTNQGTTHQILRNTKFQRKQDSQLVLLTPEVSRNLIIKPGQTIQFEFQCQGTNLGITGEVFLFKFKDFVIARKIQITVFGNKEMNQLLECKFDTVFKVYNEKIFYKSTTLKEPEVILYGPKLWKRPKFIKKERKCIFNPPPKLVKILENNFGKKCFKALTNYAPYLKSDLNFEHYPDRFHLLLFIEEIELKKNFRKYDLHEVFLTRSDNYFVIEVPGLVEKRPSLIIGDKVSLTQSWYDGGRTKHIGFIYSIREKEIYVKFHDSFHANYKETECDISFEPNTYFFSRCHDAVNRAVKSLGESWLFPSSVSEKPPVINIEVDDEEKSLGENVANVIKKIPKNETEKNEAVANSLNVKLLESELKKTSNDLNKFTVKKKLAWVNKSLNERQKLAVVNVLKGTGRPLPYIIFGPPGTGKTITLVEIIIQIYRLMPESRILVTTPSNSSADLITERLIESGNFKPGQLLRLVALYRVIDGLVPPKLIPYSTFYSVRRNERCPEVNNTSKIKGISLDELPGKQRIIIATCVTIGHLHYTGLPPGHFTHILVDEAGQTTEPEILISTTFQNIRNGQVVLIGDPQQLGPVICSQIAKSLGLGATLLQRLISTFPYVRDFDGFPNTSGFDPRFITKLNLNYRSVPEILSLPSRLFYNSDLIAIVSQTDSEEAKIVKNFNFEAENRDTPPAIIFHGLIGQNYQEKDSPSWFNPHEVWQVVFYVRKLYSIGLTCDDIGIVSPYSKQAQKLKALLLSLDLSSPKIGSVEEFQGQERLVIIVSTVRSSAQHVETDIIHSLGFVASPQRLNVALTRARALLIIIGNPVLLSRDPYWVTVVNYCIKNKSYIGCSIGSFSEKLQIDPLGESLNNLEEKDPEKYTSNDGDVF